jgi:uncharacterized protein (TIRG00374 family)
MRQLIQYSKPAIFLLLGCFLLWISFKDIDLLRFNDALKRIPIQWIFLSMLLGYLAFIIRGLRWYLLIEPLGYKPKKSHLIHAIAFGYLFNSFIPRSGELVRCTALNKTSNIPVSALFGHVLLERLIDFIILGFCIWLSFILNHNKFLVFSQDFSFPLIYILYFLVFLFVILVSFKFRKNLFKQKHLNRVDTFIIGLKEGFLSFRKIQNKLLFSIYTALIWLCYLFMTVVCFFCFDELQHLTLSEGLFIMVAGGLGMVVPTPTGIGSYHYLVIKALVAIGITYETAGFFALIVHSSQALMILLSGAVAMMVLYMNKKNSHNE